MAINWDDFQETDAPSGTTTVDQPAIDWSQFEPVKTPTTAEGLPRFQTPKGIVPTTPEQLGKTAEQIGEEESPTAMPDQSALPIGSLLKKAPINRLTENLSQKYLPKEVNDWREGLEESAVEGIDSLTTPKNIALMSAGGGVASLGKIPAAAVSSIFTYMMAKQLPDIYKQLETELKKPEGERDQKAIAKLIGTGAQQLGMTTLAGAGTVMPFLPKKAPPVIPKEVAATPPIESPPVSPEGYAVLGGGRFQSDKPPPPEAINVSRFEAGGKVWYNFRLPPKPTVSETTPPVPPAEMPKTPTESGFYPAIRLVGGEVVVGKAGETHPDIIAENKLTAKDIDQRGFVNQDGVFRDREQTAAATGLPTEQEPQRQHSTDLPEAVADDPIVSAAIRMPNGEVRTGQLHPLIEGADQGERGFVTKSGKFLTEKESESLPKSEIPMTVRGDVAADEIQDPYRRITYAREELKSATEDERNRLLKIIADAEQEIKKGEPSAETIRSDQGQPETTGQERQGSQEDSSSDVQRPASGPPNEPAPQEGQAPSEVLLKPEEPTKPATVKAATKIQKKVQAVAKTEGQRSAKEVKSELVQRLEKAIENAPAEDDAYNEAIKKAGAKPELDAKKYEKQKEDIRKGNQLPKVTIDIPGDGVFTVFNTKENLTQLRDRAKAIKTGAVKTVKESKPAGGIPPDVFVQSSEPTHDVFIKKGGSGGVYTKKGKPVILDSPKSEGLKFWMTSDGKEYGVTEQSTGTKVGDLAPTQSKAIKNAIEALGKLDNPNDIVKKLVARDGAIPEPKPISTGEARPITDEGAMQNGPGIGIVPQAPEWLQKMAKSAGRKLEALRKQIPARIRSRPERHVMDQTADAIDNMAGILGRQMSKSISIGASDVLDRAASAVIAAKFDRANLPDLLAKAVKGKNVEAANAIRYAQANWPKAEHLARKGEAIFDWQLQAENQHGINTLDRDNYLPGVYDTDLWMGRGRPYMISGGGGLSTAFKKGKTYDSPFHAIEEGYVPKTLKLSELIEHRVKQGQRLINRVEWGDSLRSIVDPTDKKPIVESLIKKKRGPGQPGYEVAPVGYVRRSVIPGVDIAVHEDYAKLFDALTGTSRVSTFEPGGIPVGPAALETAGAIKHGLLLFDTFHVSRIGQKQLSLTGKTGFKKGLTLLDYSNRDLADAVKAGEITQDMADYANANRPKFNLLIKAGLNVGRIQENMYNSLARSIPGIGTMNKWVFEKMTRGAMAETGLIEFERVKKENPKMSDQQVAQKVSRDINQLFGNLGRQGIFKDPTFQDLARLVFLAPQWVESMARTELRGFKGATIDPIMAKQIPFIQARGSIGRSMRNGLVAYFVGTQLLNLAWRGKFTWQNEEKGHKLDAWIPDVTGKSKGFFLSPFAVFAELTHDLLRYARSEPDIASALSRIVANKLSPFARAEEVLRTGRDWDRQKVIGSWERMRHAAWALAPTPIPLSAPIRAAGGEALYPGQTQRQLTASAGIKTEPAETAQNQIRDLAKDWMKNSAIPAVRARYERSLKEEFGDSDYKPLRTALIKGDYVQARRQLDALLETKSAKTILKTMRPVSAEGRYQPFTGSKVMEVAFVKSLTPQEKELYKEARKERVQLYQRFVEMLKQPNEGN